MSMDKPAETGDPGRRFLRAGSICLYILVAEQALDHQLPARLDFMDRRLSARQHEVNRQAHFAQCEKRGGKMGRER